MSLLFQAEMTKDEFLKDPKTQSAIQHQLMIMGEAVKRLSDEFCNQHPEIPWSAIAGMRDRLIHAYEKVSLDIVWDTVTISVPALLAQCKQLLPDEANDP